MHAVIHAADVQDRDGGVLVMATLFGLYPLKIRVNVLSPGATSTPGWHALAKSESENAAMQAAVKAATPLGQLADPTEIASAALFLASADSSFVTGSELFVDGGSAQI